MAQLTAATLNPEAGRAAGNQPELAGQAGDGEVTAALMAVKPASQVRERPRISGEREFLRECRFTCPGSLAAGLSPWTSPVPALRHWQVQPVRNPAASAGSRVRGEGMPDCASGTSERRKDGSWRWAEST
jgi:hypothetical protein